MWVIKNGDAQPTRIEDGTYSYWRGLGYVEWQPDEAAQYTDPASPLGTALRAAFVPVWVAGEVVAANVFRLSPDGTIIRRSSSGTTRANWDSTEQALWTVTAGLGGGGGGTYSDEQARDAIGAALRTGTGITITVDDAGDTITIGVADGSITPAKLSFDPFITVRPERLGAKPDARTVIDAVATGGSTTLTSATAAFAASDVGKTIVITLSAPTVATLSAAVGNGAVITSLPVNALGAAVPAGQVTVTSGSSRMSFTTTGAAQGATSIPVTSVTTRAALASGSSVIARPTAMKTTVASVTNSTTAVLAAAPAVSGTALKAVLGTDNMAALTSAVAECVSTGKPLYLSDATGVGEGYLYDGTLVLPVGIRSVRGAGVEDLWSGVANVATYATVDVAPWLRGSVLICAALSADAVSVTHSGRGLNLDDFGIRFAAYHANTGHGITAQPRVRNAYRDHGLFSSRWDSVKVHGHDGDHYAFNITNPIGLDLRNLRSFGGGALRLFNDSNEYYYGNSMIDGLYAAVVASGSAHGIELGGAGNAIQLCTWSRPQIWTWDGGGLDVPNPPVSEQLNIYSDLARARRMTFIFPDMESVTAAKTQYPTSNTVVINHGQDFLTPTAAYSAAATPRTDWNGGEIWQNPDRDGMLYTTSFTATPDGTNPSTIKVEVSVNSNMSGATTVIDEVMAPASPAGSFPKTYTWKIPGAWYCRVTTARASYNRNLFGGARLSLAP